MAYIKQWTVDGTTYDIKATVDSAGRTISSAYVQKAGDTMTGNLVFPADKTIIQNQASTSNYTTICKWYKGSASQSTYDPQIGQHNTGGSGTGSICILPYPTTTSPWGGTVGLFIGQNILKLDNQTVLHSGNWSSYCAAASHSHSYLPLSGGTMTGQILTSFKSSVAVGSYMPSVSTIPNLVDEVRYSSGCMGSVSITTAYTLTAGGTISTGWYNFLYVPHRSGGTNGSANSDNHQYGTLELFGMTIGSAHYRIRIASSGSISESRRVWNAGDSVTSAVWNDYAEYREASTTEPGRVIYELGNDKLELTNQRMIPGCEIISDTWGFSEGETEAAKTPVAVAGRVLAYGYEPREEFMKNIGRPVCSGPGGTVSIMTDEEYKEKAYCAIGIISAVPDYEEWGGGEAADREPVKVNGRIWIRIK